MKNLITSLAVLFFLAFVPADTNACSCAPELSPCEAYTYSSAIFIGVVSSVKVTRHNGYSNNYAQIAVEDVFLGNIARNVEASSSSMLCGYEFKEGKRYLIYVHGKHKDQTEPETSFSVSYCGRTRPIEEAEEDLRFLRVERWESVGGRVYGTIEWDYSTNSSLPKDQRHPPVVGAQVTIEGKGKRFDLVTDGKGWFEARDLESGLYSIDISLPEGVYANGGKNRNIYVIDRGCAKAVFYVNNKGER